MRTEQRLTRIEQQVQQRADRRVDALTADLSSWTDEEIEAAIWAIENEPQTPEFQAYRERLRTLTNEELRAEHQRELLQFGWSEAAKEGRRAL